MIIHIHQRNSNHEFKLVFEFKGDYFLQVWVFEVFFNHSINSFIQKFYCIRSFEYLDLNQCIVRHQQDYQKKIIGIQTKIKQ